MEDLKQNSFMRRVAIGFLSLYQLAVFISIAVILSLTSGDCYTGIRDWLIVIMGMYIFHPIFSGISELILYHQQDAELSYSNCSFYVDMTHTIIISFYFIWFIVGNVLYFVADGCSDFEKGYDITLALIILHYVAAGIVFVALFGSYITFLGKLKQPTSKPKSPEKGREQIPMKEISVSLEDINITTRT